MNRSLAEAIEQLQLAQPLKQTTLTGGCMHNVHRVVLADGSSVVCKHGEGAQVGAMLQSEVASLEAIADTHTMCTPKVLGLAKVCTVHVLVLSFLKPGGTGDWPAFGRSLAAMHLTPQERLWGFASDTWLGGFRQPNTPCSNWHEFLRGNRLEPQVRRALDAGLLPSSLQRDLALILDRLPRLVPVPQRASVLHGDLWRGNCHVMASGKVAVLDPAVWVGDAWADIAMSQLFGGVPSVSQAAWCEVIGDTTAAQERLAVHKLYHLLNHLNQFGTGYLGSVEAVVQTLA
jgi:fructosamine-3-kinase